MTEKLIALQDIQHSVGVIEKGQPFGVIDLDYAETLVRSGQAKRQFTVIQNSRGWAGLLWDGATVACLAGGPTLTLDDCAKVREWRSMGENRRVIVVNTTYEKAPWADVVYAGDDRWWRFHWDRVSRESKAEFFALDHTLQNLGGGRIIVLKHEAMPGLGTRPGVIREGGNSGYQALCLAYWAGAKKIILLGYDCHSRGGSHHHGDHPQELQTRNQYRSWLRNFETLGVDLAKLGDVDVVNCSPDSDITTFRKAKLEEELAL